MIVLIVLALGRHQEIGQYKGNTTFALCLDPQFREQKKVTESAKLRLFKVHLPNQAGHVSVVYRNSMTLAELKHIVEEKSRIETNFQFQPMDSKIKRNLPLTTTLGEIEGDSVAMVETAGGNSTPSSRREIKSTGSPVLSNKPKRLSIIPAGMFRKSHFDST
jgi:hypothetical protein